MFRPLSEAFIRRKPSTSILLMKASEKGQNVKVISCKKVRKGTIKFNRSFENYPRDRAAHDFLVLFLCDTTSCVVRLEKHLHFIDDTLLHRLLVLVLKLCDTIHNKLQ